MPLKAGSPRASFAQKYLAPPQNQAGAPIYRKKHIVERLLADFPRGADCQGKIKPSDLEAWLAGYEFGFASHGPVGASFRNAEDIEIHLLQTDHSSPMTAKRKSHIYGNINWREETKRFFEPSTFPPAPRAPCRDRQSSCTNRMEYFHRHAFIYSNILKNVGITANEKEWGGQLVPRAGRVLKTSCGRRLLIGPKVYRARFVPSGASPSNVRFLFLCRPLNECRQMVLAVCRG